MVEQEAVNFEVAGSSPASGAKHKLFTNTTICGILIFMTEKFGDEDPVLKVEPLYEDSERTIVRIALRGLNRRTINHRSTTTYEVISGTGTMDVDGVVHELSEGAVITVPAGTPYHDEGQIDMRATSIPPFDINTVEFLN